MAALKTQSVPALDRALTLLETLVQSRRGLALSELSRKLRLPKSSIHCLLLTLERRGYLQRDESTKRYILGLKFFSMAHASSAGLDLRQKARPFLMRLGQWTRLTVHMAVLEQAEAVLIEKIEPPTIFNLATWVGKRMDVHCTGVGKALLAFLPEDELALLLARHRFPRRNEFTIVSPRKLKEHLAKIREKGYAVDDQEDEIGLRCVGAPIIDHSGRAVAAISVSGAVAQITDENLETLAAQVKQAALRISRELGYQKRSGQFS